MAIASDMSIGPDGPAQPSLADAEGGLKARAFELSLEQHHARIEHFRAGGYAGGVAFAQHPMGFFACGHGFLGGGNRRPSSLDLIEALLDVHGDARVEFGQAVIDSASLGFCRSAI